jgi:hypothetical protein
MTEAVVMDEPFCKRVCHLLRGSGTCRYLVADADGFDCAKLDPAVRAIIDQRIVAGTHKARGDHCPGVERIISH